MLKKFQRSAASIVAMVAVGASVPIATATPQATPTAAATTAGAPCELHIWPAERMSAVTTGWLSGLGVVGALADSAGHSRRNAANQAQIAGALDSQTQLTALGTYDMVQALNLPAGTTIVEHPQPLDRHTINSIKTRRSDSRSGCYFELITADVAYQKRAIYGRSLRTLFMLRDFGNDSRIDFEYKAWGGNAIHHFPPAEGEDATVGLAELVTVFKQNFDEYATNERAARARRPAARS